MRELGVPLPEDLWTKREGHMPAPKIAGDEFLAELGRTRQPNQQVAIFRKYCTACHVGQPEHRMNFMNVSDDAELLKSLQANPEVRRRLDWDHTPEAQRMPPAQSPQRKALESAKKPDRLTMLNKVGLVDCIEAVLQPSL